MTHNSDQRLIEVSKVYIENGSKKAEEILGLKPDTLSRYIREAKKRGIFNTSVSSKSKYIDKIIEQYNDDELKVIANGKRQVLESSKKLNIDFNGNTVKFGVMTDTHIGHSKFFEERVYATFTEFEKQKVDMVLHAGDVTEGMSNRPGHIYELTHLGYEQQKNYAIEIFKQYTYSPVYAISGNHDRWYIKSAGANIVKDIDNEVENFHFLGHDEGDILINGKHRVRLWHGEDGSSYALSYRVQKIIESLQGGDKPEVMFCGHTHKYVKMFERNVHAMSVGCIEDQTSWMRSTRKPAHPGFGIYEITFNNNGVSKINETFYPFY